MAQPDKSSASAYIDPWASTATGWQEGFEEDYMAFRPNYGRDRAERDRAARARSAEKQQQREEKSAQRKAARAAAEDPGPQAAAEQNIPGEDKETT
jgi:hypothetical protein